MAPEPQDDFFAPYESQYVTDLNGQLIRFDAPTQDDLKRVVALSIDGRVVEGVPLAVPATDALGNVLQDEDGHVLPRRTTVYDAVSWRYRQENRERQQQRMDPRTFPGPDPDNPVPVLCHQNHQRPIGVCRVCSVLTVKNGRPGEKLIPACQHPLVPNSKKDEQHLPCMEVHTIESPVEIKAPGHKDPVRAGQYLLQQVNVLVELLSANSLHEDKQAADRRYNNELLLLRERFFRLRRDKTQAVPALRQREPQAADGWIDETSDIIKVDHNNCILCDRCVRGCSEVKPFKIIGHTGFGHQARISFDLGAAMGDSECVKCGECAVSCPTGALTFKGTIYDLPVKRDPWADEPLKPKTLKAEVLAEDRLFAGVPYAFMRWNQGAVGKVKTTRGLELCREGDYGSTAFLLRAGKVEVVKDDKVVATLGPADLITGELACLSHQPRAATLRAAEDGEVWIIKRNMLQALQRNRHAREILGPIYRKRSLANFQRRTDTLFGLPPELSRECVEFLKGRPEISFISVEPKQSVFLEGQEADAFYVVYRGFVSVTGRGPSGQQLSRDYLGPGRYFGEIAFLSDPKVSPRVAEAVADKFGPDKVGRRTGSCTALDHVELVVVPRAAFLALLKEVPEAQDALEEYALRLLQAPAPGGGVNPLLQAHVEAGLYQGQSLLVLDLNRCTRCQECAKACASSHNDITRLLLEGNRFENYLVPSACRSCHDPQCLTGCPVDAIHRKPSKDGTRSLAIFVDSHCIGCGLCAHNCPYGSIHMYHRPDGTRRAGEPARVATNCDLCESLDGNPRCVYHCPHDAAMRLTGLELAQRVGLRPQGPAPVAQE